MSKTDNHDGSPIDPQDQFFAAPPPEIGELLSASTTLSPRNRTNVIVLQTVQGIAVGAGGALLFGGLGFIAAGGDRNPSWRLFMLIGATLGFALGAYLGAKFLVPHFCSYVGREGAVRFARYGTIVRKRLVPFVATGDVRIKITRILLAGRHVGDVYDYRFVSTGGQTLLALKAPTAGADKHSGAHIHFARAAQRAWETYRARAAA